MRLPDQKFVVDVVFKFRSNPTRSPSTLRSLARLRQSRSSAPPWMEGTTFPTHGCLDTRGYVYQGRRTKPRRMDATVLVATMKRAPTGLRKALFPRRRRRKRRCVGRTRASSATSASNARTSLIPARYVTSPVSSYREQTADDVIFIACSAQETGEGEGGETQGSSHCKRSGRSAQAICARPFQTVELATYYEVCCISSTHSPVPCILRYSCLSLWSDS